MEYTEGLTPEQASALEKAMSRERKNPQAGRVERLTDEQRRSWGITTQTASEQAQLDEHKNPSKY